MRNGDEFVKAIRGGQKYEEKIDTLDATKGLRGCKCKEK